MSFQTSLLAVTIIPGTSTSSWLMEAIFGVGLSSTLDAWNSIFVDQTLTLVDGLGDMINVVALGPDPLVDSQPFTWPAKPFL